MGKFKYQVGKKLNYDNIGKFIKQIRILCKEGSLEKAIQILHLQDSCSNPSSYKTILNLCLKRNALPQGKMVHAHMIMRGFYNSHNGLLPILLNLYSNCLKNEEERQVFDKMWEEKNTSFRYFLPKIALACGHLSAVQEADQLYQEIVKHGLEEDCGIMTSVVNMYAKCGRMDKARQVFDKITEPDTVAWNSLIRGYVFKGFLDEGLECFRKMTRGGNFEPDFTGISGILPACQTVEHLMEIHREVIKWGIGMGLYFGSSLVGGYAKFGKLKDSRKVFDEMPVRNLLSYTVIISGYVHSGNPVEGLRLYLKMRDAGIDPDIKGFAAVLPACAALHDVVLGEKIHCEIVARRLGINAVIASALVSMYAQCGLMEKALEVFDQCLDRDIALWNSIISSYSRFGPYEKALEMYCQMRCDPIKPNGRTFVGVLTAIIKLKDLQHGMLIHREIVVSGLGLDSFLRSTLMNMYANCGNIGKAMVIFESFMKPCNFSWSVMITACFKNGDTEKALGLFEKMLQSGVKPSSGILHLALSACCNSNFELPFNNDSYSHLECILRNHGIVEEAESIIKKMQVKSEDKLMLGG